MQRTIKIVCAGGGSGGHVTPVLAVISELKRRDAHLEAWFICDRGFEAQARQLAGRAEVPLHIEVISAGKLRRYYGIPLWRQLLDMPTLFANLRDLFRLTAGFFQSVVLLRNIRPDVVFTKGGFVCVPVGYAARFLGIPLVIHDSDAHPGLTNRLLSRHAAAIATGAPLSYYRYPASISKYVGIPVNKAFHPVVPKEQASLKRGLGYDPKAPLILVTGGGLGAVRLNNAMVAIAEQVAAEAQIVHLAGASNAETVRGQVPAGLRYEVLPFVDEKMAQLVRAADIVVTRAGATTLLELAAAAKPIIIIPNPHLVGGHQSKNAAVYKEAQAALVIEETSLVIKPAILAKAIKALLNDKHKRAQLSRAISELARPEAAKEVAQMIIDAAKKGSR